MKRFSVWPALFAMLAPQPILAFDSGVNALAIVDEIEKPALTQWAFAELQEAFSKGPESLDPILTRVAAGFDLMDAEIAAFIAQGQQEQARLEQLIEAIGQEQPQRVPVVQETMLAQPEPIIITV